mmetsp:Transcript_20340/g.44281  ORF Transcript_20340/g.44281 Transcript_20340/m.44281 type:complete len:226 (+) Transcript_20340:948-1625(+)
MEALLFENRKSRHELPKHVPFHVAQFHRVLLMQTNYFGLAQDIIVPFLVIGFHLCFSLDICHVVDVVDKENVDEFHPWTEECTSYYGKGPMEEKRPGDEECSEAQHQGYRDYPKGSDTVVPTNNTRGDTRNHNRLVQEQLHGHQDIFKGSKNDLVETNGLVLGTGIVRLFVQLFVLLLEMFCVDLVLDAHGLDGVFSKLHQLSTTLVVLNDFFDVLVLFDPVASV